MKLLTTIILASTCLITYFCKELDFFFTSLFFDGQHFFLEDNFFLWLIFKLGTLPAWITGFACLFIYAFSFLSPSLKAIKKQIIFLLLALLIGPGILVNAIFKDHWGRPRPVQTIDFKGKQEYVEFYRPKVQNLYTSKSFPSGHASMGFYFMSLILLGHRVQNTQLRKWGYLLTFSLTPLLAFARIAQGGHYFSDVWMSGVMVYFTCIGLDYCLLRQFHHSSSGSNSLSTW